MKRGQVTIFLIIAILIIGAVALFFTLRGTLQGEEVYAPEVVPIANFVQECIDETSQDALYFIGLHGGYYFPAKLSTPLGIPYYLIDNETFFPSKEEIEIEISKYVDEALPSCTNNFTEFKNFQIKQGKIKTKTFIFDEEVVLNVEYPLAIKKGDSTFQIKDFETELPIRLGIVYNTSKFIVEQQISNKGEICINCLVDFQTKNEVYINIKSDNDIIVYEIVDFLSVLESQENIFEPEPYSFRFAVKY